MCSSDLPMGWAGNNMQRRSMALGLVFLAAVVLLAWMSGVGRVPRPSGGAESRQQIGWVIVGGMSLGTLLTLFVIPTVYSLLGKTHVATMDDEPKMLLLHAPAE